jgi:UDP-N-acetylglucosamine--N-acetylmuramyl-(pentapeptide) pyrophosphoryl-undecaprenol N-acetylglucosamine transferase
MKVIIAGGGTGGHLFPALALGEEMVRERPDTEVLYVGTSTGFEAKWLPKSGYRYELFDVHGLLGGRGALARARSVVELIRAIGLARATLRRFGGELVVSAGGYASAPMGIAAILARVPLVLMEQNTTPGFSNRMLQRFADRICVGFADAAEHFRSSRVAVTGNPVRYTPGPDRNRGSDSPIQILVLGGSTGAHRLNIGIVKAFKIWGNSVINFAVTHQTGEADVELVRAQYADLPLRVEVVPFIDDVAAALNRSDLVVARAGAMTVTDVALAGCPTIFVPYPFHRDRQQEHNARVLERVGAAVIVFDDDKLAENLARELARLTADRKLLAEMGRKARQAAHPDAARRIAELCFDLVEKERKAA